MEEWQKPETIATWIAIALLLTAVLATSIALLGRLYIRRTLKAQQDLADAAIQHQKNLLETSVLVQERERERIAADLHDDLMGKLHVLALTSHSNGMPPEQQELLDNSIATARRIAHDLSPPMMEEATLSNLITAQLQPLKKHFSIATCIRQHGNGNATTQLKLNVLRVFQEVLNNIIKHAQANKLQVLFRSTQRYVALCVVDDGRGFNISESSQGLGMRNIELRVLTLRGRYRFTCPPGAGTRFILLIPQPTPHAHAKH